MLQIDKLDAGYGAKVVLRSVSMTVPARSAVAIIGANGAGKSTLLRTIAGSLKPMAGTISLRGRRTDHLPAYKVARSGLLLVPEGREIFPELTVLENLQLGGLALAGRAVKPRFSLDDVYGFFPRLLERRRQAGGSLSGGEQQMLAIGRALMGSPDVLLLDEPSLGLAPKVADDVFTALARLAGLGISLLIVEQRVERVLQLVDYAYVLERGSVVKEGAGSELLKDPQMSALYLGR